MADKKYDPTMINVMIDSEMREAKDSLPHTWNQILRLGIEAAKAEQEQEPVA